MLLKRRIRQKQVVVGKAVMDEGCAHHHQIG